MPITVRRNEHTRARNARFEARNRGLVGRLDDTRSEIDDKQAILPGFCRVASQIQVGYVRHTQTERAHNSYMQHDSKVKPRIVRAQIRIALFAITHDTK